jgi:hypothetical protein
MKIIENADSGNSPKNNFVQNLEIAISKSDFDFIEDSTSEDLEWEVCGHGTYKGSHAVSSALKALNLISAKELTIEYVLSHGKTGASKSLRASGEGNSQYVSHFFRFSSAKGVQVSRITSMVANSANDT